MEAVVTKPSSMIYKNVYEKLITGILFCENLCLPVVDVHDDVGTSSANKNFLYMYKPKTYIEYGGSNLQLQKNGDLSCQLAQHSY